TTVLIGSALLISILIVLFVVLKLLFGSPETSEVGRSAQFTNSNYNASVFDEDEISTTAQTTAEAAAQDSSIESNAANGFSSAAPTTLMPELTGGTYQGVINNEELKKWIVLVPEQEYNEDYDSGVIFYQDIPVGTSITSGQIVNIKVSKGSSYATVPDFHGMLKKDYLSQLDLLNIKYDTQSMQTTEVMDGYVAKTSKPINDKIDLVGNEVLIVYIAENPNSWDD
ncbi:MAG: PASTA domain-containing protein, partial [Oscillospiraceae bacterium]